MCNKGKKDQTASPQPSICQAVCSAREFVSFASLSVTWSWHLCVLLLLLLSLPLSLMPLARSCPICIPSLSILCSPLCTLPSPTGIERAYQLLGQTITWCNIDFFHCRFSISHFIHSFCFSSFFCLCFCCPSVRVSRPQLFPAACVVRWPLWVLFGHCSLSSSHCYCNFCNLWHVLLFDLSQEAVAAPFPCSGSCLPFLLTTSWKASSGPATVDHRTVA